MAVATSSVLLPAGENGNTSRKRPESLRFTVVRSDNGEPVKDAKLNVRMYGDGNINSSFVTDEMGQATFEYPDGEKPVYLWATVNQPGLVPYYVNFGNSLIPSTLPTEKTIRLDPGKKVGGIILDEQGKPVADAQLSITIPATDSPGEIHYHLLYEKSQEDGSWLLDGAPLTGSLSIRVEHPRFIKTNFMVQDRLDGKYTLDPGLKLTGRVIDQDGKPIPTAKVTVGRDRWGTLDKPASVEKDGTYAVYALSPQSTFVTVEAADFSPMIKPLELHKATKPLEFQLEPGHTTRFRLVNSDGEPLAGMRIVADTWNGYRSLWWQATTDAEGLATWTGAPSEPVEFHLLGKGYAAKRDAVVGPQEEPHEIELLRPLKIEGTVTNANKEKVPEFKVSIGRKYPGREDVYWSGHESTAGRNGKFEISYDELCDEVYLRVEASGSRPWTSAAIPFRSEKHKVFIKLEAGSGPAGVVLTPSGEPAADAQLILIIPNQGFQFVGGDYRPHGGKQTVQSDKQGRFEFLSLDETYLIAAVHDTGYAEVLENDFKESGKIELAAWAKVEVQLRQGDQPLADAVINVNPEEDRSRGFRISSYSITGKTDAEGLVSFQRVVPRDANVYHALERRFDGGSTTIWVRGTKVSLKPGETASVTLGGTGALVTGRFVVKGTPLEAHQWASNDALRISSARNDGPADERKTYQCLIDSDGSFQIHDLPPGKYDLHLSLNAAGRFGSGNHLGSIFREIEIKDGQKTLDLGIVEGEFDKRLGVGDKAPLFAAKGLGNDNIGPRDLRGRLVLLDFWHTERSLNTPGPGELARVSTLVEEFADDKRFDVISLSCDPSEEVATKAIEQGDWNWRFAFAGPERLASTIGRRYELRSLPERFLVDVDGTILYRGRDLNQIAKLVRDRLQELPAELPPPDEDSVRAVPQQLDDGFISNTPAAVGMVVNNMDFRNSGKPAVKGPGFRLWSADGNSLRNLEDFGTAGFLNGPQRIAFDAHRQRIYACDTLNHRLLAVDRSGRQLFATDISDPHAISVDESTGDIWCLCVSYLHSGELLVLDSTGREKSRQLITAFGLAYSPVDDAFWIIGKSIRKMNRDGEVVSDHPLPDGGDLFTHVVADRQRGGVWVLERRSSGESRGRLWRIKPDGEASPVHTFGEKDVPRALTTVEGRPWVATLINYDRQAKKPPAEWEWQIQRFDLDGSPIEPLNLPAQDIAVGVESGSLWVRTKDGITNIDPDGKTLLTIPLEEDVKGMQLIAF